MAGGAGEEAGLRLTDANGGLAPQQQLQALRTVGQAAVVQGRAALPRLFVQVPAGKDGRRERERGGQGSLRSEGWGAAQGTGVRKQERQSAPGFVAGRASRPPPGGGPQRQPSLWQEVAWA